jgi:hypothetical protein
VLSSTTRKEAGCSNIRLKHNERVALCGPFLSGFIDKIVIFD